MAKVNAYTAFLSDPDPDARRAELRAYVGPRPEPVMKMYEGLRERAVTGARPRFGATTSFVVMAFFLGPCWFFYRRMWKWAWALVAAMVIVTALPISNRVGFFIGVALSTSGRFVYLQHAIAQIVRLRGAAPIADLALLAREGGVSKRAGWISSAVYVLLSLLAVAAIFLFLSDGGNVNELR